MRNKGIWIAISVILSAGLGFTTYTRSYVRERQTEAVEERPVEQLQSELSAGSPVPTTAGTFSIAETAETADPGSYPARLNELDRELAESREKDRSQAAGYPARARLENELSLWQSEVDLILDVLEGKLDGEERKSLLQHQQEWLRDRESRAVSASAKLGSAVAEELEYIRSQAEDTRARAYELCETYAEFLQ